MTMPGIADIDGASGEAPPTAAVTAAAPLATKE